ncbi:MAG TPA: A/G-specific adenine glycosylase [Halothiobacillaceae bacterium]|nr:A/G-specific adenine glycosylase [Halothiobacillaceae bacterium]
MASGSFATRLLQWFSEHGRHDLPWQHPRTPYRVWVSEVMLQQTQVSTVIPYFQRFLQRFPDLYSLAGAEQDEVLALWAGLGYYARGRNLHKAAQLMAQNGIPEDQAGWAALPGIGPSTAAAIIAQAYNQPAVILDGNVKRVMARHAGVDTPLEHKSTLDQLWAAARERACDQHPADYTQAIMDLGASVCRRSQPECERCPVAEDCYARLHHLQQDLPVRVRKKALPERNRVFLWLENPQGEVLLEQRPPSGIWGGLYSLPVVMTADEIECSAQKWGLQLAAQPQRISHFGHRFTHFKLNAEVHYAPVSSSSAVSESQIRFVDPHDLADPEISIALPKPLSRLFQQTYADKAKLL